MRGGHFKLADELQGVVVLFFHDYLSYTYVSAFSSVWDEAFGTHVGHIWEPGSGETIWFLCLHISRWLWYSYSTQHESLT